MTNDLKREVIELVDLMHRLLRMDEDKGPAKRRLVLDLPEAHVTLMAWLAIRRRMALRGRGGPSPWPVHQLDGQTLRRLARSYIAFELSEHFNMELRDLAMGTHPALGERPGTDNKIKGGPL